MDPAHPITSGSCEGDARGDSCWLHRVRRRSQGGAKPSRKRCGRRPATERSGSSAVGAAAISLGTRPSAPGTRRGAGVRSSAERSDPERSSVPNAAVRACGATTQDAAERAAAVPCATAIHRGAISLAIRLRVSAAIRAFTGSASRTGRAEYQGRRKSPFPAAPSLAGPAGHRRQFPHKSDRRSLGHPVRHLQRRDRVIRSKRSAYAISRPSECGSGRPTTGVARSAQRVRYRLRSVARPAQPSRTPGHERNSGCRSRLHRQLPGPGA